MRKNNKETKYLQHIKNTKPLIVIFIFKKTTRKAIFKLNQLIKIHRMKYLIIFTQFPCLDHGN
ncbi:hypothetical protein CFB40_31855 [Burkholderia sp. AU31652]|nr:hypothetical protein CFB40_31855 [Burkholderia sp. AU31652]